MLPAPNISKGALGRLLRLSALRCGWRTIPHCDPSRSAGLPEMPSSDRFDCRNCGSASKARPHLLVLTYPKTVLKAVRVVEIGAERNPQPICDSRFVPTTCGRNGRGPALDADPHRVHRRRARPPARQCACHRRRQRRRRGVSRRRWSSPLGRCRRQAGSHVGATARPAEHRRDSGHRRPALSIQATYRLERRST